VPGAFVVLDLPAPASPDARPLRDGDEVEVEVAGLGLLRNRIQL
jgi:2-keto-4-pentenoate hydratase/2-oxohepta-3-ene-1,7-dioic acid hydratase in catechol pathway